MENMVKEAALKYNWISPKDYLAAERVAEDKHEYFDGEVVVMQGASLRHEDIVSNLVREIGNKLKGKDCRIRASNLRTASPFFKSVMYPDATIVCGEPQLAGGNFDILQNPVVVFEVVSKSSLGDDYGRKLMYYRQIPSLIEYVLIHSVGKMLIEVYRRNTDNKWTIESLDSPESELELTSVGISITLQDIYENIFFDTQEEDTGIIE
jgi:Uma2 family endonuclease